MKKIKNGAKKTVCKADPAEKLIEIKLRGQMTVIKFEDGGSMKVVNSSEKVRSVLTIE